MRESTCNCAHNNAMLYIYPFRILNNMSHWILGLPSFGSYIVMDGMSNYFCYFIWVYSTTVCIRIFICYNFTAKSCVMFLLVVQKLLCFMFLILMISIVDMVCIRNVLFCLFVHLLLFFQFNWWCGNNQ